MDFKQSLDAVLANPAAYARSVLLAVLVIGALIALFKIGPRLWRVIEDIFFTNWQLAMLGSAALALSLAGGWTTWDGMTNFTGEPVLSLMFTFGIHCVMLIVAWLIGESFATGMSTVARSGVARATVPLVMVLIVGAILLAAGVGIYQYKYGVNADHVIQSLIAAGALCTLLALVTVFARTDVVAPYAQALRIMAKNSMLWVMFLACMATSVFFSFDSRFNVVFPQEQRERVSELRATNQVSAIIADIGATIASEEQTQTAALFQSEGWHAYESQLDRLASAAQSSTGEIERYFNDQIEVRNRAIKEQQERITTAQSGQAGIAGKKTSLTDELARLEGDRATLAADYASTKSELDARAKAIDAKRVEAMAESKGVEGTLKEGRGPVYRQLMGDLSKMQAAYKIQDDRVKDAKKRLDTAETRIAQIKRELASIDGELAKYKGEEATAAERIRMAQETTGEDASQRIDPGRVLPAFETARAEFRQSPTAERLAAVQQRCGQLYSAMYAADVTKAKVSGIDCDPKQASEAAAVLFTLQAGTKAFNANCVGGDKLAAQRSTDALFGFAVKCLSDSGLPSQKTDELRSTIAFAEMNRDDKAHRFVVSWNAFQDGNRLAYLALAIAIGIDSLIFMTGLFGANAVRSPLADVPSSKGRNSQQLEAIIENALLPDTLDNARATLNAMRPITNATGFMAEVRPEHLEPHMRHQVMGVLNAGATISAVEYDTAADRYLVRAELYEFLSIVAKRSFEANRANVDLAELEKIVGVALLPDINANADTVLSYMHPIDEDRGFTAEINLGEVLDEHRRTVRSTLNAGATLGRVQRRSKGSDEFWIHRDLYKTLARIRARTLMTDAGAPRIGQAAQAPALAHQPPERFGGSLTERTRVIAHQPAVEEETTSELRAGYVTKLLAALNLKPDAWARVSGSAHMAAIAAHEALTRARRSQPALDTLLRERDDDARRSFDEAYTLIQNTLHPQGAAWERRMLEDAYQELDQHWSVLMLLPNGPYEQVLREAVEQLEPDSGGGQLSVEQQSLLEIARALLDAFQANPRADEMAWRRLSNSIATAQHAQTHIADNGHQFMN